MSEEEARAAFAEGIDRLDLVIQAGSIVFRSCSKDELVLFLMNAGRLKLEDGKIEWVSAPASVPAHS